MKQFELGEFTDFTVFRNEPNMDRACDAARKNALLLFDVDEWGHINNVKDAHRSTNSVEVTFVELKMVGGMTGWDYFYTFRLRVV